MKVIDRRTTVTTSTIKNIVDKSISREGQAKHLIIDTRNVNISNEILAVSVSRTMGITRGKLDVLQIIKNNNEIVTFIIK